MPGYFDVEPFLEEAQPATEKPLQSGPWWCCAAPFGEHETTCKNYVAASGEPTREVPVVKCPHGHPERGLTCGPECVAKVGEFDARAWIAEQRDISSIECFWDNVVTLVERAYAAGAASGAQRGVDWESQNKAAQATEKKDCEKALLALAGWYPTPVEGYGWNSSWAISDLCKAIVELREAAPAVAQTDDPYSVYANHCAIQGKVPMTWHSWKREHRKEAKE